MDCRVALNEELLVLESIYGPNAIETVSDHCINVTIDEDLTVNITIPETYPVNGCPIIQVLSPKIPQTTAAELSDGIRDLYCPGEKTPRYIWQQSA